MFSPKTLQVRKDVPLMIDEKRKLQYYEALVAKDSEYEGLFYVGVKTTGVFCRPLTEEDWNGRSSVCANRPGRLSFRE